MLPNAPPVINSFLQLLRRLGTYLAHHRLLLVIVCILIVVLPLLVTPEQHEESVLAPLDDNARLSFGGNRVVAQEFTPLPGLAEIRIPVGTAARLSGPLILHVRVPGQSEDVRTSALFDLTGPEAHFTFAPLRRPPEKLRWILETPHSPASSFWVYHELDSTAYSGGRPYVNAKELTGNFAFTQASRQLLITDRVTTLLATPDQPSNTALRSWEKMSLVVGVIGASILFLGRYVGVAKLFQNTRSIVLLLAALSLLAHVYFARSIPIINDEGAYVQDVLQAKTSFWPFRDYLTKGPFYLVLLKLWQLLTPHSFIAWRFLSAVSWAAATVTTWLLARELGFNRRTQLVTVLLLALSPAAIVLTTPLLLQVTSVPLMLIALYAAVRGAKTSSPHWLILSSLLMNVAFFTRVSSVVAALIGAVLIFFLAPRRWYALSIYIVSGLVLLGCIFLLSLSVLGLPHTAVLFNAEALVIAQQRTVLSAETIAEPPVRQLLQESRVIIQNAPYLITGVFLLPILLIKRKRHLFTIGLIVSTTIIAYQIWFNLTDMGYLLPGSFRGVQNTILLLLFGIPLLGLVMRLVVVPDRNRSWPREIQPLAVIGLWLLALIFMYGQWGRFRQNYLVEFLVPLALVAGWSFAELTTFFTYITPRWLKGVITAGVVFIFSASVYQGFTIATEHPHTGTIDHQSLQQIVAAIQKNVPPGEVLFTAQPVITAAAKYPIVFGYAHPGWYREERFDTIPAELRALFFIEPAALTEYFKTTPRFVVMEKRTEEIYFDGFPERQAVLEQEFERIISVSNEAGGGNFDLYQRKQ